MAKSISDLSLIGSNNFAMFPSICLESKDSKSIAAKANCLQFGASFTKDSVGGLDKQIITASPFRNTVYGLADFKIFSRNFGSDGEAPGIGLILDLDSSGESAVTEDLRSGYDGTAVIIKMRSISYVHDVKVNDTSEYPSGLTKNKDDDIVSTSATVQVFDGCEGEGSASGPEDTETCINVTFKRAVRWFLCSQVLEEESLLVKLPKSQSSGQPSV